MAANKDRVRYITFFISKLLNNSRKLSDFVARMQKDLKKIHYGNKKTVSYLKETVLTQKIIVWLSQSVYRFYEPLILLDKNIS